MLVRLSLVYKNGSRRFPGESDPSLVVVFPFLLREDSPEEETLALPFLWTLLSMMRESEKERFRYCRIRETCSLNHLTVLDIPARQQEEKRRRMSLRNTEGALLRVVPK